MANFTREEFEEVLIAKICDRLMIFFDADYCSLEEHAKKIIKDQDLLDEAWDDYIENGRSHKSLEETAKQAVELDEEEREGSPEGYDLEDTGVWDNITKLCEGGWS